MRYRIRLETVGYEKKTLEKVRYEMHILSNKRGAMPFKLKEVGIFFWQIKN